MSDPTAPSRAPRLGSIKDAASILAVGEGQFRKIMAANPTVAESATVVLGPRCVRYRLHEVEALADSIARPKAGA